MLDTKTETPIPLAEAARLIPPARQGKKTHLSTLLRWIMRGARNPNGPRGVDVATSVIWPPD